MVQTHTHSCFGDFIEFIFSNGKFSWGDHQEKSVSIRVLPFRQTTKFHFLDLGGYKQFVQFNQLQKSVKKTCPEIDNIGPRPSKRLRTSIKLLDRATKAIEEEKNRWVPGSIFCRTYHYVAADLHINPPLPLTPTATTPKNEESNSRSESSTGSDNDDQPLSKLINSNVSNKNNNKRKGRHRPISDLQKLLTSINIKNKDVMSKNAIRLNQKISAIMWNAGQLYEKIMWQQDRSSSPEALLHHQAWGALWCGGHCVLMEKTQEQSELWRHIPFFGFCFINDELESFAKKLFSPEFGTSDTIPFSSWTDYEDLVQADQEFGEYVLLAANLWLAADLMKDVIATVAEKLSNIPGIIFSLKIFADFKFCRKNADAPLYRISPSHKK